MSKPLIVITSLDVEEEGLFSGAYPQKNLAVSNVSQLPVLAPLSLELGFPLTLFCTHSVFINDEARKSLTWMKEHCRAEIGAHLHHWSTPPYMENAPEKPERTDKMPKDLFISRLESLLNAGQTFLGEPLRVFRMGRWDLKAQLLPILAKHGILVDSSINPLRAFRGGPNHFDAPADPYWVEFPDGGRILEAPITQIPIFPALSRSWRKINSNNQKLLDSFHFFGALSVNPFWHGEKIMRLAVRLHKARGGRVINLFWHSSEMQPGCSPHVPDMASRNKMLNKIFSFMKWLKDNFEIMAIPLSHLLETEWTGDFASYRPMKNRDW